MATPTGNIDAEKDTQQSPMPSEQQNTTDAGTPATEAQQQTSVGKDESGLPTDVSERTRREFDKLKDSLKEERARREYYETAFSSINTPVKPEPQSVYDPQTGLLNEQVLNDVQQRSLQAEERARRAESAIQNYLYQQEEREAYNTHPELKTETFSAQARGIMYDSAVNPQNYGKQFTLKEAADYLKGITTMETQKTKEQAQKEVLEQITPKEQASLEAEGGSRGVVATDDDYEQSRWNTRTGDIHALVQRLHKITPDKQ